LSGAAGVVDCINVGVVAALNCWANKSKFGGITGEISGQSVYHADCYYDKQLCVYGGIGNNGWGEDIAERAEGKLTRDMTGTALRTGLGADDWIYTTNFYPILKNFANNKLCEFAISPAYFYAQNSNRY
jgi:hypothetical protein